MATPKKKYSPLWNHFEEVIPHQKAKCNYCNRLLAIHPTSIGSFNRHMKCMHPEIEINSHGPLKGDIRSTNKDTAKDTSHIGPLNISSTSEAENIGQDISNIEQLNKSATNEDEDIGQSLIISNIVSEARLNESQDTVQNITNIFKKTGIKDSEDTVKNINNIENTSEINDSDDTLQNISNMVNKSEINESENTVQNITNIVNTSEINDSDDTLQNLSSMVNKSEINESEDTVQNITNIVNKSEINESENTAEDISNKIIMSGLRGSASVKKRSPLWYHFDEIIHNQKAKCHYCGKMLATHASSIGTLGRHLRSFHPEIDISTEQPESLTKDSEDTLVMKSKKKISPLWNHFEEVIRHQQARCHYCSRVLAIHQSSIGSLNRHMKTLHPEIEIESRGQLIIRATKEDADDEGEQSESDIWSFFEQAGAQARCAICRTIVPRGEMKEHMREKHPKLMEENQDSDDDTGRDSYTEVVYLEEASPEKPKKIRDPSRSTARESYKSPRPRHRSRSPKPSTSRSYRSRSPVRSRSPRRSRSPIKKRRDSSDDEEGEIKKFTKYISCLLKTVPKELSTKLQMDIIHLIMTAKLQHETETKQKQVMTIQNTALAMTNYVQQPVIITLNKDGVPTVGTEVTVTETSTSNSYSYGAAETQNTTE